MKKVKKQKKYYKSNNYIHYSNCHEDVNMIINNTDVVVENVLSIASGGDNSFACLLLNPKRVVCIDTNPSQVYLVKLKKAAIKYLDYEEYLVFIGIYEGDSLFLYNKIKDKLENDVASYFNEHIFLINEIKIVNCGRFEYYFNVFSKKILPLIHSKKIIDRFMSFDSLEEQKAFYLKKFNNIRFKLMFKLFFSKFIMKRIGRDKDYFKYNKGSLSKELKERFELGIFNNLNKDNPYLQYVIYNKFIKLPLYLQYENYEKIKNNIDKVEVINMSLDDYMNDNIDSKFDLMNLSDIFEYIDNNQMNYYENKIYNMVNKKGKVVFWNMQNDRTFADLFVRKEVLLDNDLAFYYKNIFVYEKE